MLKLWQSQVALTLITLHAFKSFYLTHFAQMTNHTPVEEHGEALT